MNGYHPDNLLEVGKDKMRRYHQEQAAAKLAQEARNSQPGRNRTAVNQVVDLFKPLLLKMEKRFGFGRTLQEKVVAIRDRASL
jgi:hypothetical protein